MTIESISQPNELWQLDAVTLLSLMRAGECTSVDIVQSCYQRIHQINPTVNAICTLIPERQAIALAKRADQQRQSGQLLGALHGIPIACKDLSHVKGIRMTMGSKVWEHNVATFDSIFVERLRQAGAIIIGKTNTPEMGVGSHTFNEIFGTTKNPYNLTKTAGGSSGGAAAVIASRMLPLADGSDMGGSLRNPAAFCNVYGLRPSIGLIPIHPIPLRWQSRIATEGPMARTVDDLGLLLSVMAGADIRDPLSCFSNHDNYASIAVTDVSQYRLGWAANFNSLPIEPEVLAVCHQAVTAFQQLGCTVAAEHPDISAAMDAFRILRASYYAAAAGSLLQTHRDTMKSTLVENIEIGLDLTLKDILKADQIRSDIYQRFVNFFKHYDFLLAPATQVVPFDSDIEWVTQIEGQQMHDYLEWMSICCIISITDLPVLSIPCGFTQDGLPLGLQIIGKPKSEMQLLQLAKAFEQLHPHAQRMPTL